MKFLEKIDGYMAEMIQTAQELIAIPSVKAQPAGDGAPFGREIARALDYVLDWGARNGFRGKNLSGYAGHLEYGEGDGTVGVLVHLDVVPAGEGWTYPSFGGEIHDDRIYGRGAVDDKGPTVAVLYALKALKDENVRLKKKIRVIFGCDEESGWACMDHYFSCEEKPECGFSPDADFPLINCEKGRLELTLSGKLPADPHSPLKKMQGGTRSNVVPDSAEAVLAFNDSSRTNTFSRMVKERAARQPYIKVMENNSELIVRAEGKSAHASLPHLGENAITRLAAFLSGLGIKGEKTAELINFIAGKIGAGTDGAGLGIDCRDEISGQLTLNLGVIEFDGEKVRLEVDIRYPLCTDEEKIIAAVENHLGPVGLDIAVPHRLKPHYLPAENPLVKKLLKAYREETGDDSPPVSIGGRTYAATLGNGVAFGPGFPGRPEMAHQKDEYFSLADLKLCARIYTRALYELAAE